MDGGSAETAFKDCLMMGHAILGIERQDNQAFLFLTAEGVLEEARHVSGAGDLGGVITGGHPASCKLDCGV
jgi:hypothetical protein